MGEPLFFSLYNHRFIGVAVCVPEVRAAYRAFNFARTIDLLQSALREKDWVEPSNRVPSADP
jgi:hypothetical protein